MKEIKSKGIKGYILSSFDNRCFFRVYHTDGDFTDYDINCEELEVELLSDWISLYESENKNILDWSSKALGRDKRS